MSPTLLDGDFILVNKYAYGVRVPFVNTRVVDVGEPERGEVIVFRLFSDPSTKYVKRLVGLPGDTIRYADKKLYLNDQPVDSVMKGTYHMTYEKQPDSLLYGEQLGVRAARYSASAISEQPRRRHVFCTARALLHDG